MKKGIGPTRKWEVVLRFFLIQYIQKLMAFQNIYHKHWIVQGHIIVEQHKC